MEKIIIPLFLFLSHFTYTQNNCNFSGLQNQALKISFTSYNPMDIPAISYSMNVINLNADVICDEQSSLSIQISYTGDGGYVLAHVLDEKFEVLASATAVKEKAEPNQPIILNFTGKTHFKSSYILLTFSPTLINFNRFNSPKYRINCEKLWCTLEEKHQCFFDQSITKPTNLPVIRIKPFPVGIAQKIDVNNLVRRNDSSSNLPSKKGLDKTELIDIDQLFTTNNISISEILNISRLVFLDTKTSIIYWWPREYTLNWSSESGYDVKQLYTAKSVDETETIHFFAELSPNVNPNLDEILSRLVASKIKGQKFETAPLPVHGIHKIRQDFSQFNITPTIILRNNDLNSGLEINFKADKETAMNVGLALANKLGLNGQLMFTSPILPPTMPAVEIPFSIKLRDKSFEALPKIKKGCVNRYWANQSCSPITLNALNFLVFHKSNNEPFVIQWSLRDSSGQPFKVPGKSKIYFELTDESLAELLHDETLSFLRWINFRIEDDPDCSLELLNPLVTGGFDFETFLELKPLPSLFENPSIFEIIVEIRSNQFTSTVSNPQIRSVSFNSKAKLNQQIGPFFLTASNGWQLSFEYRIIAIDLEGTKTITSWQRSQENTINLGSASIK